jgi:exodeoxyribonuclease-3
MTITVATWNVNSVKARLTNVLEWLEENKPDFLMMQEIKTVNEKFPYDAFKEIGYFSSVNGMPAYHGVATLSREEVTVKATALPGDDNDTHARFIDVEWNDWRLINIYAPNGNPVGSEKFAYKLQWLDRLQKYMKELLAANQKFVVGGDYNIIPEDFDAKHPDEWLEDALYQPESKRKYRALQNMGMIDAFRSLHPKDHQAYTFWDYQAGSWHRNNGIRIDHFLVSPKASDKIISCEIDKIPRGKEKPSDHTPVMLTLQP